MHIHMTNLRTKPKIVLDCGLVYQAIALLHGDYLATQISLIVNREVMMLVISFLGGQ